MKKTDFDPASDFHVRSTALVEAIERIKKEPPAALLEFKESHPEHKNTKGINCALIADFIGMSESTLSKLKSGAIANPVCSTAYLLWLKTGLNLYDFFGIPHGKECNEKECTADMRLSQVHLNAKDAHIKDLERQLEKEQKETTRLRTRVLREARALAAVFAMLVIVLAVCGWLLYKLANPSDGIFGVN